MKKIVKCVLSVLLDIGIFKKLYLLIIEYIEQSRGEENRVDQSRFKMSRVE